MAFDVANLTKQWQSYRERFGNENSGVTEVYTHDWETRSDCRTLIGFTHSDYTYLECTRVEFAPLGDPDTTDGGPETALVTVIYTDPNGGFGSSSKQPDENWDNWNEHWEGGGEGITIGEGLRLSDAAAFADCKEITSNTDISAVMIFPTATVTVMGTINSLIANNGKALILDSMGKVNAGNVTIKGFVYGKEKLLFLGADLQEGADAEGNQIHQLTYKFAFKQLHTWNEFFYVYKTSDVSHFKGESVWEFIINKDGNRVYGTNDFATNLNPDNW
ncbi:hypothetical protein LCGC14_0235720 [marine sediment metagenome]|uniref:Uncharacterized protein n=1 Tax=marine sediment metagenome TaxID=412755 RepID=A0A0F9WTT1_9ZZZZ